jgi:endonuclease/exonuclease/phosphatase family metal-dependent hydrolase
MMTREFVWLSCANWRRFWIALFAVLLLSSGWGSSVSAAAAETVTGATPKVSDTTPVVGQELTAIPGAWGPEPVSFSYQWFKGSTAIGGATSATYTVGSEDVGGKLKVMVIGSKDGYTSTSKTSKSTSAVAKATLAPAGTPTVSETSPTVDQLIRATPGTWGPGPVEFTYQWSTVSASGKATKISRGTEAEYRVQGTDAGSGLTVTVTGSKAGYAAKSTTSAVTRAVAKAVFSATPKPTVAGTARVGMVLTGKAGTYDPTAAYTYRWYRGTGAISGATKVDYMVTAADLAKQLTFQVTAVRSGYVSVTQDSDPTGLVQAGFSAPTPLVNDTTPQVGEELSITNTGLWTPAPDHFTYQWFRGSSAMAGATSPTYRVEPGDLSAKLKVTVTAEKADFAPVSTTSASTSKVASGTFTTVPVPTISGEPAIGKTLTADEGLWTPVPASFEYQWYRSGSAISGAKARTYVVAASDAGKALTVKVTGKNSGFSSASQTSVAVTPGEGPSSDLRVASFNISGANNDPKASGDQQVWADRRPVVASQILGESPDVVGLQEAYEGTLQYTSLRDALNSAGRSYEITELDPGASRATRILYNTSTLEMLSQGEYGYTSQVSGRTTRYLDWANFRQKSSGKEFLFVNTHLSPEDTSVKTQQWRELIVKVRELNTAGRPVVAVGDFNTSKFMAGASEMLPAMKSAGFGDVMNQEYQVNPPKNVRAEQVINGWINSFNDYRRDITPYSYSTARTKVGNGIDWVFATNSLRVKQWKVVIDFDPSSLQIRGVIPSDHNMISSVIVL